MFILCKEVNYLRRILEEIGACQHCQLKAELVMENLNRYRNSKRMTTVSTEKIPFISTEEILILIG